MTKIKLLIITICISSVVANAQDSINVYDCLQAFYANYPLASQYEKINEKYLNQSAVLKKNYLPDLQLQAKASYQSDVIDLSPLSDLMQSLQPIILAQYPTASFTPVTIPSPRKDQYDMYVNVNQLLYDGGTTKALLNKSDIDAQNDKSSNDLTLFQRSKQVYELYFNTLILKYQLNILNNAKETLETKIKALDASVNSGVIIQTDLDQLIAEKIKIEQQINSVEISLNTLAQNLSTLTGLKISIENIQLTSDNSYPDKERPEYAIFDNQSQALKNAESLITTNYRPKIAAFARYGYANPGIRMISDEFSTYYILGAQFSWNFFDWNTKKLKRQEINIHQDMLKNNLAEFDTSLNIQKKITVSEIEKYKFMIKQDSLMLEIRKNVVEVKSTQLNNGVTTTSDYLTALNELKTTQLNLQIHAIELTKKEFEYWYLY